MYLLSYMTLLSAEDDRMQDFFRALRTIKAKEGMNDAVFGLLILAGIIALMLVLSFIIDMRHRRRGYSNPRGLFWNLCRAHKLKWSERWLLWRLARLNDFADPARLFLEPEWFVHSRLPAPLVQYEPLLKSIRNRLFSELKEKFALKDHSHSATVDSMQPKGAALSTLKGAPNLDISPWPGAVVLPPLPPLSNSADSTPV
jgi:hypothetical protein